MEFDVRRLADGSLVAFHDETAAGRRTAGMTREELSEAAGYDVPRVEDVLAALRGRTHAHIDLKEAGCEEQVVAQADAALGRGGYVLTTLEEETVRAIKRTFPGVRVGLTLGRGLSGAPLTVWLRVRFRELFPAKRLAACGADFVSVHQRLARLHVLRTAEHLDMPTFVWTVDSETAAARLSRSPVLECIVTDEPERLSRMRMQMRLDIVRSERH